MKVCTLEATVSAYARCVGPVMLGIPPEVWREVKCLQELDHGNVVQLQDVFAQASGSCRSRQRDIRSGLIVYAGWSAVPGT